jgi:hypothetical protein
MTRLKNKPLIIINIIIIAFKNKLHNELHRLLDTVRRGSPSYWRSISPPASASYLLGLLSDGGHALRLYAASRKVADSCPEEVDSFKLTQSFRLHYCPGVDSASNRNEYQESLKIKKPGSKVLPARWADNLAAIY